MVELRNVSVTYSNGVDALNDVSIKIKDGEFVFVVGKSGAGKSTFIRLLLKEIEPTKGRLQVNGFNLTKMKKRNAYRLRRTIGCVFQDFKLIESMNVYDNVAFVLRCIDASNKYIRNRVPYVIDLVGLKDKAYCKPSELSGGEKQRAAIARALVNDPQLIIADEPTGNLDPDTAMEIMGILEDINRRGTTVVMATHAENIVNKMQKRVIMVEKGQITRDEEKGGYTNVD